MKRFIKSAIACVAAAAMLSTVTSVTTFAAEKAVTVKTQKEFEKAVKAGKTNIIVKATKAIKISTTKAVKITISSKSKNVAVEINAKNASVTNNASVKSITIKGAKSFTENGEFNDIKVATTQKMTLNVSKKSTGADITIAKAKANVTVKADGNVGAVNVESKNATVNLTGKSNDQVEITAKADNAKITSSVPAKINVKAGTDGATVTAKADVTLNVAKNATLDKVSVAAAGAAVDLNAKGTVEKVEVAKAATGAKLDIDASGKVASVTVNAKADVAVAGSTNSTVKITVNAADTTVTATTAVDTTLNADTKVELGAGAEGSKVTAGNDDVKVDVSNGTKENITITDSKGNESTVEAGKDQTTTGGTTDDGKKEETTTGGGGGGYVDNTTYYYKPEWVTPSAIRIYKKDGSTETLKATLPDNKQVSYTNGTKKYVFDFDQVKGFIKTAYDLIPSTKSTTGTVSGKVNDVDIQIDYKTSTIVVTGNGHKATISIVANTKNSEGATYKVVGEKTN